MEILRLSSSDDYQRHLPCNHIIFQNVNQKTVVNSD